MRNVYKFWLESLKKRDRSDDLVYMGNTTEIDLKEMGGDVDWIHLAQDRNW
jgi:hypothetical protein